jgi:hypothetical protein
MNYKSVQRDRKVNIAIILDSPSQPAWVVSAIEEVLNSNYINITKVLIFKEIRKHNKSILYKLFLKIDRSFCLNNKIASDSKLVKLNGKNIQSIEVICPAIVDELYVFNENQISQSKLNECDLILYYGNKRLGGPILRTVRYGVWSHGGAGGACQWGETWNVLKNIPLTSSTLWIHREKQSEDLPLYQSYTATDQRSIYSTENRSRWKAVHFVPRILEQLDNLDWRRSQLLDKTYSNERGINCKYPTDLDMLKLLPGFYSRYGKDKVNYLACKSRWMIGFVKENYNGIEKFQRVKPISLIPPSGAHWADPFPWIQDGKTFIFCEEIPDSEKNGQISVFNIDEGDRSPRLVIQNKYHMSYPFLFTWNGELYMLPETSQNKTVEIYRCKYFPYEWELTARLFEDVRAADTTLVKVDNTWWLFTSFATDNCDYFNDELSIFYSDSPFGPWKPHKRNPVISDVRCARSAGRIYHYNDNFYRPAQNSSVIYGNSISINRIIRLTSDEYKEETVGQILPNWHDHIKGTHTFNFQSEIVTVDGLWQKTLI